MREARIARATALAVAVALIAAGSVLQGPATPEFRVNAVFLLTIFLVPALGLYRPADVAARWAPLLATAIGGTFAWDVATAKLAESRGLFADWPLVYTVGPLALMLLYLAHASLARLLTRMGGAPKGPDR